MRLSPLMISAAAADNLPDVLISTQSRLRTSWRLPLWCLFLGLTSLIVAYPTNFRLRYFPVEALYIFVNLPLFVPLFYLWMASLLVLLFTPSNKRIARWERLALTVLSALVFWGFWIVNVPIRAGGLPFATASELWQSSGRIISTPYTGYYEWPGHPLFTAVLSSVTGLEVFPSAAVEGLFTAVVIAIAAYAFLLVVLKSSLSACLASLVVFESTVALVFNNDAAQLGLALVTLFLMVLFQKGDQANAALSAVLLFILAAVTVTHFFAAGLMFLILLGQWLFAALRKHHEEPGPALTTVVLFLIVPVAWIFYMRLYIFRDLTLLANDSASKMNILTLTFWFGTGSALGQSNFAGSIPPWISWPRLFLAILNYVLGSFLWLWSLRRFRRLDPTQSRLSAAFFGLGMVTVVLWVVYSGGFYELRRPLLFGAFLPVPFLFLFLQRLKPRVHMAALIGLAVVLFALSFPSFIRDQRSVASDGFYNYEFAGAEWLHSIYGTGEGLTFFTTFDEVALVGRHLPYSYWVAEDPFTGYMSMGEEGLWQALDKLLANFERAPNPSPFFYAPRIAVLSAHFRGVSSDSSRWADMPRRLSERNHKVYDNGTIVIYMSNP